MKCLVGAAEHRNLDEICTTRPFSAITLTSLCAMVIPDVRRQSLNVILCDLRVLLFWVWDVKLCHWLSKGLSVS
jgi:hypothetical protein